MTSVINGIDMIVVQYVESSLSNKLLGKFPDNVAFDYSQSALWSPPIRRFHNLYLAGGQIPTPNRRLSFENERRRKKKVTVSKIKRKIHSFAVNFNFQNRRLKFDGSNEIGSDSSESPPAIKKGWEKVLKITSKKFKKKKKKDPTVHVKLSDYLQSQNY